MASVSTDNWHAILDHIYVCVCIYIHIHIHTYIYVYIHIDHIYTHINIHIHVYTHTYTYIYPYISVPFGSVAQLCLILWDPMNCSTPGLPVHHQFLESTQTHVHRGGDAIQPSHPLSSPSPPALNLSQHQGLFKWVNLSHQVAKVLDFQLQHQSCQWTPGTDLL